MKSKRRGGGSIRYSRLGRRILADHNRTTQERGDRRPRACSWGAMEQPGTRTSSHSSFAEFGACNFERFQSATRGLPPLMRRTTNQLVTLALPRQDWQRKRLDTAPAPSIKYAVGCGSAHDSERSKAERQCTQTNG